VTNEAGFNLLDEPWILSLDRDGKQNELSILELFERSGDLLRLGGDVPTQGFAIARLLLAFLHCAVEGPQDQQEWAEFWLADALPMDKILKYATKHHDRFDLFHPETPFFQVPGLRTGKAEVDGVKKIIADVPDGEPLFTTRSPENLKRITAAEAARWLVHVHAYDTAGIKSGAVGDPKATGGKGYGSSVGWSGQIGGVLAEGATLKDTLLLNLIAYEDAPAGLWISVPGDLPPWERDVDTPKWSERPPNGVIAVYTWQTRRVRLIGDPHGVTGVVLCKGDRIEPQNKRPVEPHTAWRHSEPQSKKHKEITYMPRVHDPARSVWRGLEAILPSVVARAPQQRGKPKRYHAPRVLDWLSDLSSGGLLPSDYLLRTWVVGVNYGVQNATFAEIVDDRLALRVALLRADQPDLGTLANDAVKNAENAAVAMAKLARNIAQAAGSKESEASGMTASEQVYAALDRPYREWLVTLGPDTDRSAARTAWQATVHRHARATADELVKSASPAAWVGRKVNGRLVNVALAEAWFRAELRNVLPAAFPRDETPPTEAT
jgi:CRISPR system Cascade subunit CasA